MRSILLVADVADESVLAATFRRLGHEIVGHVSDVSSLEQCVHRLAPDVIVVSADAPDGALFESLERLAHAHPKPVVMFAKDPRAETIRKSVACGVSAYVVDGWSPERLTAIVEAATARFEAWSAMRQELARTRTKLSERKIVEKAKGIVMQQRGLSEEQAYSSLRKMAMDQSLPLAEVARRVISVSQLLS
jgi:two-component system, response regulator / RNA-binding antiterminator